ncbi:MAG TPA: hypothetical protein VI168_12355 [Croceibacterium sp.]
MKDDRNRLRRAKLIERVRRTEKQRAASEAFAAEARRAKLAGISERTLLLGQAYADRASIGDGAGLRSVIALSAQLHKLGVTASRQADQARVEADARLADLASADRRHKRADEERRGLAGRLNERAQRYEPPVTRPSGTDLE